MGIVLGPIDISSWITMKALKYDIQECAKINTNGKFDLAIKCNQNCLKSFYKDIWERAA